MPTQKKRDYDHQYWLKNKARINARNKTKRRGNLVYLEKRKKWYQTKSLKYQEYSRKRYYEKDYPRIQKNRDDLFELLGGAKCVRCGFTDKRALQFDHIAGDGYKEVYNEKRKWRAKSKTYYLKYLSNPELAKKTLQVLCSNCNWIKRAENKEYSRRE